MLAQAHILCLKDSVSEKKYISKLISSWLVFTWGEWNGRDRQGTEFKLCSNSVSLRNTDWQKTEKL